MAFIEYVYSIANDTLNGEIAPSELVAEIQADPLASVGFLALRLSDVTGLPTPPDPSDVFIGYDPALDAAGQAALTALVGAHGGAEAPSDNALNIDQDVEFNGSALSGVGLLNGVGFDTFASDTNTHVSATNNPHATDLGNLGSGTLAELNALLTDATLNPSGTPTAPTAHASTHEEGGSDELAHDDLAGLTTGDPHTQYLNSARFDTALAGKDTDDLSEGPGNLYYTEARVTANTSVDSNTTHRGRVDNPHATDLGNLGTGTLAELNAVVTNATLDDAGDARTPIAHATTHEQGGSDELLAQDLGSGVGGAGQLLETDGTGGWNLVAAPTIISDHGGLGGLGDDDHPQYLLTNGGRTLTGDLNLGTNDITNVGTVDGVDVSAQAATTNNHIADTNNPHATDLGNLGTGTLAELNALVTNATLDDVSGSRTPTAHAATHVLGGADEIDGDRLDIDYTPSSYTPATTAPEVNDVDHLSAHLTGINNALGTLLARVYGTNLVFVESLGNSITTSTAFVQKLRLSSTIPAGGTGTYRLDWSYFWNHDSQANDFLARIQQNDASTLMDHQQEPKDSAGSGTGGTDQRFPASGMIFLSLTAGVAYNFDLDFATNDGNSSSAMFEARMTLYRIA